MKTPFFEHDELSDTAGKTDGCPYSGSNPDHQLESRIPRYPL